MTAFTLQNATTLAEIHPAEGGRVASLRDRRSGRELLLVVAPQSSERLDYSSSFAGGWEEMFPNDSPWGPFPFHGVLWNRAFMISDHGRDGDAHLTLFAEIPRPAVDCRLTYSLLTPPRAGLKVAVAITARADTRPFLWTSHPALAVAEGWQIELDADALEADWQWPGRFAPGPLSVAEHGSALRVPGNGTRLNEVLYASCASRARVTSPDHSSSTAIAWSQERLRHLWVTTIARDPPIQLAVLIEPSTSRPFDLDRAIADDEAMRMTAGDTASWWVSLESLDTPGNDAQPPPMRTGGRQTDG